MQHNPDVKPLQKGNLLNAKLVISYVNTVD